MAKSMSTISIHINLMSHLDSLHPKRVGKFLTGTKFCFKRAAKLKSLLLGGSWVPVRYVYYIYLLQLVN